MNLAAKKCVPCEAGIPPMNPEDAAAYLKDLRLAWILSGENQKIGREFKFKDFVEAIDFINKVADIAEEEGHHPDIFIFYNRVRIELSTHAVSGLTENDFILAAKIEEIASPK